MNSDPRRSPDDSTPAGEPGEGERDGATPLPASPRQERQASDPVESDQSIAGEEDPGAALDSTRDPPDDSALESSSKP